MFKFNKKRKSKFVGRKERRKQERRVKKEKKRDHYLNRHKPKVVPELKEETKSNETKLKIRKSKVTNSPGIKKIENSDPNLEPVSKKKRRVHFEDGAADESLVEEEKKYYQSVAQNRKRTLFEANAEDDKIINSLGKKLHLNKKKSKSLPKSFADEGLDYILDLIDGNSTESKDLDKKKITQKIKGYDKSVSSEDEIQGSEDEIEDMEDEFEGSEDEIEDSFNEKGNSEDDDKEEDESEGENSNDEDSKTEYHEDIYGRLRDKEGNIIESQKYVAPAKRVAVEDSAEGKVRKAKIKRQLKGFINRLSEATLKSISSQIEDMYGQNSRNDMNEILSQILMDSIVLPFQAPEKLHIEHAALISLLHANVGTEIGAFFLQKISLRIEELFQNSTAYSVDKTCDNLILMLCHLYNFKVVHATLLYDLLDVLVKRFQEKDIELILLIIKNIGFTLRKDDPSLLKQVILNIQAQASEKKKETDEFRVQFMIEILMAIKNNNMRKVPGYDPSYIEHMKKVLHSFIHAGLQIHELKISYNDLLQAEEKGRWWIIGSAWSSGLKENDDRQEKSLKPSTPSVKVNTNFSKKVLEMAQKQHMNTEIRKNIFCILVTADDYMDAFEKVLHLALKNVQQQEIIHVILHCSLQEKKFNPYYSLLLQKFCEFDRKFKRTLQFDIWDKLKEIDKLSQDNYNNLARVLLHCVTCNALSLTVLKVIHLGNIEGNIKGFLETFLRELLLKDPKTEAEEAFTKLPLPKYKTLKKGLLLFAKAFLLDKASDDYAVLKKRIRDIESL